MCGNLGLLLEAAAAAAGLDAVDVLKTMAEATQMRGGQSAGVVALIGSRAGVRVRCVPGRREEASVALATKLRRTLSVLRGVGKLPPSNAPLAQLYLGHTRFATSSLPSVTESHPHQWSPPPAASAAPPFWRAVSRPGAPPALERVTGLPPSLFLTHNGA